jgi:long-subunit acyl-CoA synthetase (AMP-forming)
MMVVAENNMMLAGLLLAASQIDAWAIIVNPRLSPRELDQIREHSTARRIFFAIATSKEAASHAIRHQAKMQNIGPLKDVAVSALQDDVIVESVELSGRAQVAVLMYTSGTTGAPKGRHAEL